MHTSSQASYSLTDAASRLGLSYRALSALIARGAITAVRPGPKQVRARFIAEAEVERFLAARRDHSSKK